MEWYYSDDGDQVGPISENDFQRLVSEGKISDGTLVWHEGMEQWASYASASAEEPAASDGSVPAATEAACCECGRAFPQSSMISYGNSMVCAACKPAFFQKVSEGATSGMLIYGGFWIRFAAKFIDGIILWVVNMIIGVVGTVFMMGSMASSPDPARQMGVSAIMQILQILIGASYTVFFLGKFGATPGKMACGLKVIMSDGGKISYGRAVGRHFAEMLSGMILFIGYIMAAFDDEKRTLHDRICDTRVVKKD